MRRSHENDGLDVAPDRVIDWQGTRGYQCSFDHYTAKAMADEDLRTFGLACSGLNTEKSLEKIAGKVLYARD